MFRNRGEVPNIKAQTGNDNGNSGYSVPHYSYYPRGRFVIVRYDKNFIIIELIMMSIILLTAFAVYLFAYQFPYEDPIASMKSSFLNAQLISIGVSTVVTGLVTVLTKSKETLIRNLRIIAIISIVIVIAFLGIKLYIDSQYNENTFEEFYKEYEEAKNDKKSTNIIGIQLSEMKILDPKENYIKESKNAYTNFSIKTIFYVIIHIILTIVIFYLSNRLSSIETKKAKLAKDDAILYDEEENVKF